MASERDTIFALSSGRPPAAIAVVRISGPCAGNAVQALTGRLPPARQATLARVHDQGTGELIDEALVLWFPGPHSETGEDVAELQIHGGRAVIAATLAALGKLPALRHAEPGEFTRRAFENGRMDLPAVEGLADLVAAETESQRRQALQHVRGLLGRRAETWRTRLIDAIALVEASIDFSDEGDVPEQTMAQAIAIVVPLVDEITRASESSGERLREGLRVAIAGPPNSGKSTLFNRLAQRDAAIVSPYPGTTRDVLEVHLDLRGYPVTVLDTAGIRPTDDPVEREGVRRATDQAAAANLVLWMTEAASSLGRDQSFVLPGVDLPLGCQLWRVINKVDLLTKDARRCLQSHTHECVHVVSAATGEGVDELTRAIGRFSDEFFPSEPALVSRERQRSALLECAEALRRAKLASEQDLEEIVAEHLRLASRALGRLLGRVDVEDVLDVIFRDFCIGK